MTKNWQGRLQDQYTSFEEFESYSQAYGLTERCGYTDTAKLWQDNPVIGGSANPDDFGIVTVDSVLDNVITHYMEAIHFTDDRAGGKDDEGTINHDDKFSIYANRRIYNDCLAALRYARNVLKFEINIDNAALLFNFVE